MKKIVKLVLLTLLSASAQELIRGERSVIGGITVAIIIPDWKQGKRTPAESDTISNSIRVPASDTAAIRMAKRSDSTAYEVAVPDNPAPAIE